MDLNSQRARFFLFVILSQIYIYISLIYDTFFNQLSDTLFEFLNRVGLEKHHLDKMDLFRKSSSFEFLKRLTSTLNIAALQSREKSVQQEREGLTHPLKTYTSSVKDANLHEEKVLDSLILLSWYIHRFWKSLERHNFPAAKLIAETYSQLLSKLPETLHYIYDSNWFPQKFVKITEVTAEIMQTLTINHNNTEMKNYNESTIYMYKKSREHRSLETSPIKNWILLSNHNLQTFVLTKLQKQNLTSHC